MSCSRQPAYSTYPLPYPLPPSLPQPTQLATIQRTAMSAAVSGASLRASIASNSLHHHNDINNFKYGKSIFTSNNHSAAQFHTSVNDHKICPTLHVRTDDPVWLSHINMSSQNIRISETNCNGFVTVDTASRYSSIVCRIT